MAELTVRGSRVDRRDAATRVAAATAFGCLAVHLALLVAGGRDLLAMTAPMLALSALCSACALRGWRTRCTDVELVLMACGGGLMGVGHLLLAPMHSAAGGATGAAESAWVDLLMHLGVTLGGGAGLLAGGVLLLRVWAPRGHGSTS